MTIQADREHNPDAASMLGRRSWSRRRHGLALLVIYAWFALFVYALGIFPSHDVFNVYVSYHHTWINSLLSSGELFLWDPYTACGWPAYLCISYWGVLDPTLWVSLGVAKLGGLDILATFYLWCFLRLIPMLLGIYALLGFYCKRPLVVSLMTFFLFNVLALCLFRDFILFMVYLPGTLAALCGFVRFVRSVRSRAPQARWLIVSALLGSLSVQMYNPTYTILPILLLGLWHLVLHARQAGGWVKGLGRLGWPVWAGTALLVAALLLPSVAALSQKGQNIPFIRNFQNGPISSLRDGQTLSTLKTDHSRSPTRKFSELASMVLPVFHSGPARMEGVLYIGLLGLIGCLWGIVRPGRAWGAWVLTALGIAWLMSRHADAFLDMLSTLVPVFHVLKQRHLLYPVFLLCATVAAVIGLDDLLASRGRRRREKIGLALGLLVAGLLALDLAYALVGGKPTLFAGRGRIEAIAYLLLLELVLMLLLVPPRTWLRRGFEQAVVLVLVLIGVLDAYFVQAALAREYHLYDDLFGKSPCYSARYQPEYQPYRAPILPRVYGTDVNSAAHVLHVPSALPAYWHADVAFMSTRFYEALSLLPPEQLRQLTAVSEPRLRIVPEALRPEPGQKAIRQVLDLHRSGREATLVVEDPDRLPVELEQDLLEGAPGSGEFDRYESLRFPGKADGFVSRFYDRHVDLSQLPQVKEAGSFLHYPNARLETDMSLPTRPDGSLDISAVYPVDFNYLADPYGGPWYLNVGNYVTGSGLPYALPTLMQLRPGEGIFLEHRGPAEALPETLWMVTDRRGQDPRIQVRSWSARRRTLQVEMAQAGYLYVSEAFDPHWKCEVDGREAEILIANNAFQAIALGPGRHEIRLSFDIPVLRYGLVIYGLAVLAGGLYGLFAPGAGTGKDSEEGNEA